MWKALEHGMVGINAGVIATGMCRLAASSSRLGRETHTTAWMITSSSSTCVWRHPELISTDNQNVRISKTGLPSLIKKKGFQGPFFLCAHWRTLSLFVSNRAIHLLNPAPSLWQGVVPEQVASGGTGNSCAICSFVWAKPHPDILEVGTGHAR
jgi:hypothetical protein